MENNKNYIINKEKLRERIFSYLENKDKVWWAVERFREKLKKEDYFGAYGIFLGTPSLAFVYFYSSKICNRQGFFYEKVLDVFSNIDSSWADDFNDSICRVENIACRKIEKMICSSEILVKKNAISEFVIGN